MDFLFIPESERKLNLKPANEKLKGFKISYHFETGMEKPEIRIEGNIDEDKIRDYLEGIDISQHPSLKKLLESGKLEEIDVDDLTLESSELDKDLPISEPYTEINDYEDYTEVILEIPGIAEEDVIIDFSEGGSKLIFNAKNETRKYYKKIHLPFVSSTQDYEIDVKNGLAIISVKKSDRSL